MKYISRVSSYSVLAILFILSSSHARENCQESDSLLETALAIYVDCTDCDLDFFRSEITFINFVRDRKLADIHVLISEQSTGSSGTEYTVSFLGQFRFAGMDDTLRYVASESDTQDSVRKELINTLKMGLVRYAARTPLRKGLSVRYTLPGDRKEAVDNWHYWVFALGFDSRFEGEKSYHSMTVSGNLSARRVTEAVKIAFAAWADYAETRYAYENCKALSASGNRGVEGGMYLGLGGHCSVGYSSKAFSALYNNRRIQVSSFPGIEYNFFPYGQSTRRLLRLTYQPGLTYVEYQDATIFDKIKEWLTWEQLSITLDLIQPWGAIKTSLTGYHYFHDFQKNRSELASQFTLRLFEGVSASIRTNISRIHDQLALRRGSASDEEVLLRRRELATSYSYSALFGIGYTFGSTCNKIVNPRFGI